MNVEHLKLFVRIAATHNISAAGAELGLSPAVASAHISKLEAELGVRLIHRTTRKVALTEGSELLAKITFPDDLKRLETLLMPTSSAPRFGTGYDVHAFEPGDAVTLCGVSIPHDQKLAGHSDADVAWHALTDAILGAAALGDIGDHFPPSDPQWKGAASEVFLKHAVTQAAAAGWTLASCDVTVICDGAAATSTPFSISSHAVILDPCSRGRVSSANTRSALPS